MKFFNSVLSLAMLAGALGFASCGSDGDEPDPIVPEQTKDYKVQLTLTDNGFDLGNGQQLATPATAGDKAGLFVVNNGTIVASNVELTYDGTTWGADKNIEATGTHYFVYKPFKSDAASKVSASATDAAAFFSGVIEAYAKPGNNQTSIEANVLPFDVTYAQAAVTASKADITEDLKLAATATHALAITTWELPGATNYTTASGFVYSTPGGGKQTSVKIGSAAISPCTVAGMPAYFHRAGRTDKLTVEYTFNGQTSKSDLALDAAAGTRSHKVIGSGSTDGGKREIAVGDLYYCDGSILPVEQLADLTEAPAGVAGVVFCTDPARFSAEEKALLGEVHGLVISAKMGAHKNRTYLTWCDAYPNAGDDGAGRYIDSTEDSKYPGMTLPLIEDRTDVMKSYQLNNNDICGYAYNTILRTRRASEIASGNAYQALCAIDYLKQKVNVSEGKNTGWYLPSVGQLLDFMRNIGKAKADETTVERYDAGDNSDFDFGVTNTPQLNANLDAAIAKVTAAEKDLYSTSDFALWTSSYASVFSPYTNTYMPGIREVLTDADLLYVVGYDIIGRGNVRGVLAF